MLSTLALYAMSAGSFSSSSSSSMAAEAAEAAEAAAKLKTPAVREDARELGLIKAINDKRKGANQ